MTFFEGKDHILPILYSVYSVWIFISVCWIVLLAPELKLGYYTCFYSSVYV